jgi:hypothetical protein
MDALLESPLAFGAAGLLLVTLAGIVFIQTRSRGALTGLVLTLALALGGVALERWWLTPTEEVRRDVARLFAMIRANDLSGVLATLDASATEARSDAQTLMPSFRVEAATAGGEVRVELPVDPTAEGAEAVARLKPLLRVQHGKSGAVGAYFDRLELTLVRRADRWLIKSYRAAQDWREGAGKLGR